MRLWPGRGKYPIDEPRRQWVDARMRWLADQFGSETLRRVPAVEPTDAFFPDQYSQWHRGGWHGWKASTLGYMTEPSFGYALGLWSQLRGEEKPAWMRHLRLNPRTYMKQTIRRLNAERTDAGR